jgi:hypothetical protein
MFFDRRTPTQASKMLAVTCLLAGWAVSTTVGAEKLTRAEFEDLHEQLTSPREAWQGIPWKLSVLEARQQASVAKKPVYMLVRAGHPLGCV